MTNAQVAEILRADIGQVKNVVDLRTPDLGLVKTGPELIRHLRLAAEALERH
jgi:hypothetical protein